jgi:uncharacterized protein (DUF427 family)
VLETSHPPSWYLPVDDWRADALSPGTGTSFCEYKGDAVYVDVRGGDRVERSVGWQYLDPSPGFEVLRGTVALYPARMDRCTVDGEVVRPQDGGFYGGWVTSDVAGPFKGPPGTRYW